MASTSNTISSSLASNNWVPIFHKESYQTWSIQMRTLLISHGLSDIVENGYDVPPIEPKENEAWDDNKRKQYEEN